MFIFIIHFGVFLKNMNGLANGSKTFMDFRKGKSLIDGNERSLEKKKENVQSC